MAPSGIETPRKTWIYVLAGVIPAVFLISMTVFVISRAVSDMGNPASGTKVTALCVSRLKEVARAQLLYASDHDDFFAPPSVWVDATWRYVSEKDPGELTESVFKCPAVSLNRDGSYGYGFNCELEGKPTQSIGKKETMPLVFDSKELSRNASGSPSAAFADGRHNGGKDIVVAYSNGSVKVQPRK